MQSQASNLGLTWSVPPPLLATTLASILKEETGDCRLASVIQGGLEALVWWQPLSFVMLHLHHVGRVTLRSVSSERSYRKRAGLGVVGCSGHCDFFAWWGKENKLDLSYPKGSLKHPRGYLHHAVPQPFMPACRGSRALGLTLQRQVLLGITSLPL